MTGYTAEFSISDLLAMAIDLGAKITEGIVGEGENIGKVIAGLVVMTLIFLVLTKILDIPSVFQRAVKGFG